MKLQGTRFVMSPGGSALGLPAGEYWAVPTAELQRMQERIAELEALVSEGRKLTRLVDISGNGQDFVGELASAPELLPGKDVSTPALPCGHASRVACGPECA